MIIHTKICINPKCKDSYFPKESKFTKWKPSFKECPTCKQKLEKYNFVPTSISFRDGKLDVRIGGKV